MTDSGVSLLVDLGEEVAFFSLTEAWIGTTLLDELGLVNSLNCVRNLLFSSLIS